MLVTGRSCYDDEFECNNSRCIQLTEKCNKVNECGDNSDELDCDGKFCETMNIIIFNQLHSIQPLHVMILNLTVVMGTVYLKITYVMVRIIAIPPLGQYLMKPIAMVSPCNNGYCTSHILHNHHSIM